MIRLLLSLILTVGFVSSAIAQEKKCYIVVENPGSYEQLVVTSITLTMVRQFVDSAVEPAPISGVSNNDCMYRVNIVEQESGIKVFIFGNKISDYGKSNLRGEAGLEQAILRAIYKSLASKSMLTNMCQKYSNTLVEYCKSQSQSNNQVAQLNQATIQPEQDNQTQPGKNNPPLGKIPPGFITYHHPTLGFSVSYPERWKKPSKFKNRRLVFSARGAREIPAMGIFTKEVKNSFRLAGQTDNLLINIWQKILKNKVEIKKLHSEKIKLPNQIKAYRTKLKLHIRNRRPIEFVSITAVKNGNVIVVGVWGPDRMPARLPYAIIRSLTFKP